MSFDQMHPKLTVGRSRRLLRESRSPWHRVLRAQRSSSPEEAGLEQGAAEQLSLTLK